MAASANVTQWLAWALMIADRLDEPPRRRLVPPGFRAPARGVRAARLTARRFVRARARAADRTRTPSSASGPARCSPTRSAPATSAPCSTSADICSPRSPTPTTLEPALRELDVFATIEIIANDTTAISTHVLPTKDQLERADVTLWDFLSPRVAAQHTAARSSTRWATVARRGGSSPSSAADSATTSRTPRPAADRRRHARAKISKRRSSTVRRARRRRLGRGRPRAARAMGRPPRRPAGRLAAGAPVARRPAGRGSISPDAARARAAPADPRT